jgi:hypothetical protein
MSNFTFLSLNANTETELQNLMCKETCGLYYKHILTSVSDDRK